MSALLEYILKKWEYAMERSKIKSTEWGFESSRGGEGLEGKSEYKTG